MSGGTLKELLVIIPEHKLASFFGGGLAGLTCLWLIFFPPQPLAISVSQLSETLRIALATFAIPLFGLIGIALAVSIASLFSKMKKGVLSCYQKRKGKKTEERRKGAEKSKNIKQFGLVYDNLSYSERRALFALLETDIRCTPSEISALSNTNIVYVAAKFSSYVGLYRLRPELRQFVAQKLENERQQLVTDFLKEGYALSLLKAFTEEKDLKSFPYVFLASWFNQKSSGTGFSSKRGPSQSYCEGVSKNKMPEKLGFQEYDRGTTIHTYTLDENLLPYLETYTSLKLSPFFEITSEEMRAMD